MIPIPAKNQIITPLPSSLGLTPAFFSFPPPPTETANRAKAGVWKAGDPATTSSRDRRSGPTASWRPRGRRRRRRGPKPDEPRGAGSCGGKHDGRADRRARRESGEAVSEGAAEAVREGDRGPRVGAETKSRCACIGVFSSSVPWAHCPDELVDSQKYRVSLPNMQRGFPEKFMGVPPACGPLLQLATAQAWQGNSLKLFHKTSPHDGMGNSVVPAFAASQRFPC